MIARNSCYFNSANK